MKNTINPESETFLKGIESVNVAGDNNRKHCLFLRFKDFTGNYNYYPLPLTEDQISTLNNFVNQYNDEAELFTK